MQPYFSRVQEYNEPNVKMNTLGPLQLFNYKLAQHSSYNNYKQLNKDTHKAIKTTLNSFWSHYQEWPEIKPQYYNVFIP